MMVGEAPGSAENSLCMPFVGQSGKELARYCRTAGIDLAQVYLTNICKVWPPVDFRGNQLPPTQTDIDRDEPELLAELLTVSPRVIVAVGAHSARYFLGDKFSTMRQCHGIPQYKRCGKMHTYYQDNGTTIRLSVPCGYDFVNGHGRLELCPSDGYLVIPVLHPAAGLHSMLAEEMARIQWDFQQVGKLLRGQLPLDRTDQFPNPKYRRLYDAEDGARILAGLLAGRTELSIDTEGTVADPECVTVTVTEGEGWMIEVGQLETLGALNSHINAPHSICTLIFHYLVHDIPVCEALGIHIELRRSVNLDGSPAFRDTMNELHLLGGIEPKSLKAAEWRLCGMEADSFEDVTKESAYETSREFLVQAFGAAACEICVGTGKVDQKYKVIDPECTDCSGSGRVPGKRAGTTKQCGCVKTSDKCDGQGEGCWDGLRIPLPPKELDFVAATGEFRWKQPQSMAKWIKRRVLTPDMLGTIGAEDEEGEQLTSTTPESSDDDELSASTKPFFKIRVDWKDLPPERRVLVEQFTGKMPRVALRNVKDQKRVTNYACRDSDATMRNAHKLTPRLREYGLERAAQIDIAILPMLSRMERNGMMIDRQHFEVFHDDLQKWLDIERTKLSDLVGEHNPNSKRMVGVLFRDLQLPAIKLTAGGQESTDDETLGILKAQLKARQVAGHDADLVRTGIAVIDCIQTYREFQKMDSTYVMAALEKADAQDRLHTTINYTKSVSRLSSEDPNLQNIPNPANSPFKDDPVHNMGLRMRTGFIARPGYKIVEADYSSIELVTGAHLTQDPNLMRIFIDGLDPHSYVASNRLGISIDEVPKETRTQMKPLSFGAFYDASAQRLQLQFALMQPAIDKTVEECQEMLDWYFGTFAPSVLAWKDRVRRDAQADGVVRTMFGRMRWMPGLRSDIKRVKRAAERECTNFPIQGTARDILCVGMARLWEDVLPELWACGIDAQPIMTVHDAVAVEAPAEHAELVGWLMQDTMAKAVELSVPVKVSVGIGDNWAEAH